ncbi:MAG: transposase family protein [Opitutaceae bacterium]|nr:transposase family protein [Opitutaceae bacterium]
MKTVTVPWAEPGSRFTFHFEAFAVAVIAACRSLTQAADLLRLHWDSVQRLIERAVERGLARRSTEDSVESASMKEFSARPKLRFADDRPRPVAGAGRGAWTGHRAGDCPVEMPAGSAAVESGGRRHGHEG